MRFQQPLAFCLWRACLCVSGHGESPVHSQLPLLFYLLNPLFCEQARLLVRAFHGKFLFFLVSLEIPHFGLLSHLSSLRLSSGHPGAVLTLSTSFAACSSLSSPFLLVVYASVWGTSPLAFAFRHVCCLFVCFFPLSCCHLRFQTLPTDTGVRGFPTVWKLFLLQYSLHRTGLCP